MKLFKWDSRRRRTRRRNY